MIKKLSLVMVVALTMFFSQPAASADQFFDYDWTRLVVSGYDGNMDSALGDFSIDGQMVLTAENYRFKGFVCSPPGEKAEEMCAPIFEEYGIESVSEDVKTAELINDDGEMRVVQILNVDPLTIMFNNITKVFTLAGSSETAPVDRFPLIVNRQILAEALYELHHYEDDE